MVKYRKCVVIFVNQGCNVETFFQDGDWKGVKFPTASSKPPKNTNENTEKSNSNALLRVGTYISVFTPIYNVFFILIKFYIVPTVGTYFI